MAEPLETTSQARFCPGLHAFLDSLTNRTSSRPDAEICETVSETFNTFQHRSKCLINVDSVAVNKRHLSLSVYVKLTAWIRWAETLQRCGLCKGYRATNCVLFHSAWWGFINIDLDTMEQTAWVQCRPEWLLFQIKIVPSCSRTLVKGGMRRDGERGGGVSLDLTQQFKAELQFKTKSLRCFRDCSSGQWDLIFSCVWIQCERDAADVISHSLNVYVCVAMCLRAGACQ